MCTFTIGKYLGDKIDRMQLWAAPALLVRPYGKLPFWVRKIALRSNQYFERGDEGMMTL